MRRVTLSSRSTQEQSLGRNSIPIDSPAEGTPSDGSAIAQWEGRSEFTLWIHPGLEGPSELLRGKVRKKERPKAKDRR